SPAQVLRAGPTDEGAERGADGGESEHDADGAALARPVNGAEATAIVTGKISAAPTPCTTRATISQVSLGEAPQKADRMPNSASQTTMRRRRPKMSARGPAVTISAPRDSMYPLTPHCRSVDGTSNWRAMAGRARLSENQSISTISIEIAHAAITSRSDREN